MLAALGLWAALAPVRVVLPVRPDCPPAADVAKDVEVLMGLESPPAVDVRIDVRDVPEGVVADVEYASGGTVRTREIPGASCREVVDAAAVVVAVGVDPIAVQAVLEPVILRPQSAAPPPAPELPAPLPVAVAEPEPPSPSSPPSDKPRPRGHRVSLGAFVRGGLEAGAVSNPSGWLGGGLQLGKRPAKGEVAVRHRFARDVAHPENASTGASVSLTVGRLAGCWTPRAGAVVFGACLGADVGMLRGEGYGLETPGTARGLWVAATPGVQAHWQANRTLRIGAVIDVPLSLVRPTLTIDDFQRPLAQMGFAGVWAGLSLEFTFFDESAGRRR